MRFIFILLISVLAACTNPEQSMSISELDIQGHRGARGLYPENSLEGFQAALDLGVHTLEMDLCMTKDAVVVVSHEPWMNADICLMHNGDTIAKADQMNYNMFEMSYAAVKNYDCGSKFYPAFPDQKKIKTYKPTLAEVIERMEAHADSTGRSAPRYNLEIKRKRGYDDVFHPAYDFFVRAVMMIVQQFQIAERTTVQCFDLQVLEYLNQNYPDQQIAYLVASETSIDTALNLLSFVPPIYSPHYELLSENAVADLHAKHIKVIPWTVNEKADMKSLIEMGVDGIITDYPDRLIELIQ